MGINPSLPSKQQDKQTIIWTREKSFLNSNKKFEKKIVHGHTPSRNIINKKNRIYVDIGVFYTGILSVIRINKKDKINIINSN